LSPHSEENVLRTFLELYRHEVHYRLAPFPEPSMFFLPRSSFQRDEDPEMRSGNGTKFVEASTDFDLRGLGTESSPD
jgi:hypothetical protein